MCVCRVWSMWPFSFTPYVPCVLLDPALQQFRSLLNRKVSPYGFATVPTFDSAAFHFPHDYHQADVLSRPINYNIWPASECSAPLGDDATATDLIVRTACLRRHCLCARGTQHCPNTASRRCTRCERTCARIAPRVTHDCTLAD